MLNGCLKVFGPVGFLKEYNVVFISFEEIKGSLSAVSWSQTLCVNTNYIDGTEGKYYNKIVVITELVEIRKCQVYLS